MFKIILLLLLFQIPASAESNFFYGIKRNLKKAFTVSEFVCDKYEVQEYETYVLRPGVQLPFTEVTPKKKECIKWEAAPKSAIGRTCKEYRYLNTSRKEESSLYMKVKRKRTTCVQGHSTR